tara:strand:- start:36005 stop:38053 length:2049 start_codon:yes stop_codon:yes gene_type:complete
MRCSACIARIESGLTAIDGIAAARVNLSAKRVAISHDRKLDDLDLTEALQRLGFEAQAVEGLPMRGSLQDRELLKALAVAGFGMMNIMLLSVGVWSGADGATREAFHWLSALIALPVIAYAGRPFFLSALKAVRRGTSNMDVPISIGVLLATGLSLHETLVGGEHAYFDGATMLLFFLLAGRALDAEMRNRTRAGVGALLGRMGRNASVLHADGSTERMAADTLLPGMVMLVAAGEALAADGKIEEGTSAIDNSMLTGESTAEQVGIGEQVHAGAINMLAPLRVRITAAAHDTALAEIARLMEEAGQSRSRYVRIADRASRFYAPAVHTLAALAFAGWMIAGAGWHESLVIAIAVLIITCPCAMGLAVPAAQVVASGALMKRGLLVKDGSALERLAEVDVAVFDKTGTLTLGEPQAELDTVPLRALPIALALAQASRHPLSRSIANALVAKGIAPARLDGVREVAGDGVFATQASEAVALRRPQTDAAQMAVELVIGDECWPVRFDDRLRSDAGKAIDRLHAMGIDSRILSGDRNAPLAKVADELGLESLGNVSPQEKLAQLEQLTAAGTRPLMVGDGLNDGPALAAAHASIAPGTASDASQQAADAVFIGERLMPVADAVTVARRTMRVVRQNFGFAIAYNMLAIPFALAGAVTPLIAAIAMSLSSLVVIGNSLRLAGAAK